jgi:hypothetical protein
MGGNKIMAKNDVNLQDTLMNMVGGKSDQTLDGQESSQVEGIDTDTSKKDDGFKKIKKQMRKEKKKDTHQVCFHITDTNKKKLQEVCTDRGMKSKLVNYLLEEYFRR